jgi:hypothetical protein
MQTKATKAVMLGLKLAAQHLQSPGEVRKKKSMRIS